LQKYIIKGERARDALPEGVESVIWELGIFQKKCVWLVSGGQLPESG
jgi:hypothetical protein